MQGCRETTERPRGVLTSTSWGSRSSSSRSQEMEQEERRGDGDFSVMPTLRPCGPSALRPHHVTVGAGQWSLITIQFSKLYGL